MAWFGSGKASKESKSVQSSSVKHFTSGSGGLFQKELSVVCSQGDWNEWMIYIDTLGTIK